VRGSLTTLLAALLTAFTLLSLAGYQVTGDSAGPRLLGRLSAALVELDRWVPVHREDIQLVARDRPQESVLVDDLPVDVVISSEAALNADDEALRDLLRAAMGRELYEEGRGVLRDETGGTHLSITEPVRWTVSLLSSGAHSFWSLVLIASAVLTLALYATMIPGRQSAWKPLVLGSAIAAVASFAVWLIANGSSSLFESSVDREIVLIARDGAWLGLRNALAVTAMSLAVLYLWRALVAPHMQDEDDRYWPDVNEMSDSYPPDAS
jgi:hypothetical protein